MRFSLNVLVRLVALLALVSGTVAVTLSRLAPVPWHFRMATPPRYEVINGFALHYWPEAPKFLDTRTGQLREFRLPKGDRFEYAACSPWEDEQGECQVVGRWMREVSSASGPSDRLFEAFGLARYELPSGRVLNRIPVEVVPATHPCWFPDTTARLIFGAGDGQLYLLDFDQSDRDGVGENPVPQPIAWGCKPPGRKVMVRDPVWSADPRLGGRLIVSIQFRRDGADEDLTPGRLWWLTLTSDGKEIVAAGPLTDPELGPHRPDRVEERYPNLTKTPDGDLAIAYLTRVPRSPRWALRLAPVAAEATAEPPVVRSESARTVADDHVSALPPFSADGRWLYGLLPSEGANRVVRFSTDLPEPAPAG